MLHFLALQIHGPLVNHGLDMSHEFSGRKVAALESILEMSFPSAVPPAVGSEISPCCFLPDRFILSAVQTHGGFLMCMMKEQFCIAGDNMQSSK